MLTPRSKVKALLAGMDSGSDDDDDDNDKDIGELMRKAAKPPVGMEKRKLFDEPSEDEAEDASEEEEEEEEEEVMAVEDEPIRPRGKMAARMMAAHVDTKTTKAAGKDGNAYERVRKSIFGGEDEIEQEKEINSTPRSEQQNNNDNDDEDEDDDIPLPTSRRKKTPLKPSAQRNSPNPASPSSPSKPAPQSRSATPPVAEQDSDSDALPANLLGNDRFLALVARKRKEREDKEAAEALKIASRRAAFDAQRGPSEEEEEDDSGADNVASQRAPTRRKAGKKALEEMHKETQRMARSMQLAHQARTRKKITKQSLFDKFNFRPEQAEELVDSTSREVVAMDVDMNAELPCVEQMPKDRPPSEQMDLDGETTPRPDKGKGKGKAVIRVIDDDQTRDKGKGKGKAVEKKSPGSKKTQFKLPAVRVILPPQPASDSDSDLEIVAPVTPQSEHRKMLQSLRAVRRASPPKMRKVGQLTTKELRAELLLKGRQQAVQEREEQIQELKAKGIIVLTAEERANTNNQVEDLLEKARLESLAIKRHEKKMEAKEKGAVKKEPGAGGDDDEDDEEDDDWLEEAEAGSVLDELSGSGSEEEGDGEKEVVNDFSDEEKDSGEDEDEGGTGTPVFSLSSMYPRDQASPSATPRLSEIPAAYIDDEADDDDSDSGEFAPLKKKSQIKKQQRKKMRVVEGDEDDEDDDDSEAAMEAAREQKEKEQQKSKIPAIFQRADDAPAFPGIGMTQLFAGTIGASGEFQMQDSQEGIAALRRGARDMRPNSQMLDFNEPSQDISQHESSRLRLDYTQSQVWHQESLQESLPRVVLDYEKELEVDDMPDPTQDVGFEYGSSQTAPPRFAQSQEDAPDSSISTQVLDSQFGIHRKRRGRLTRRETEFSDVEEEEEVERADEEDKEEVEVEDVVENVFDLMKKASKKKPKKDPIDMEKLRADTKGLVHDQAEESEDEYAGIGGASDDEADAGRDSEMEDLMDDTNNETVDEAGIAAYYAEREKVQDEKDVNKLLKDLQSGLLRKKRGAEFDLDDSDDDDDGEARRRAKRRQMAKMRKELMKDGNIEKIANNPKRLAFLSAIEDRDRDEEMDFLDRGEEDLFVELGMVSQSQDVGPSLETSQSPDQGNSDNEASPTPGPMEEEDPESRSKEASREITPLPIPQSKRPVKNKVSSLAQVREVSLFYLCE